MGNSHLENKGEAKVSSESAIISNILFKVYLAVASHGHARLSDVISRYLFVTDVGWAQSCPKLFRDVSRVQGPDQQWNAYFQEWKRLRGHLRMTVARGRLMIVNNEMIMKYRAIPETVLSWVQQNIMAHNQSLVSFCEQLAGVSSCVHCNFWHS